MIVDLIWNLGLDELRKQSQRFLPAEIAGLGWDDSGHAFLKPVSGDFTASTTVTGAYETLYDQAGLMLRIDATHWVKTGIEFTDGLDFVTQAMVIAILHDEEGHRRLFEGYLREYDAEGLA